MKSTFIFFIFILVFIIVIPTAFSMTYVVYENTKSNTYEINHKLSDKDKITVLRKKANELNPVYYEINERNEEKERLLEKRFRRIHSWYKHKDYHGYDEEFFGSKKLYLNWKDAKSIEEKESFHPTKGYDDYKCKTFLDRIEKYSLK